MAKKKKNNKTSKVVNMQGPENYIRTRARKLPIIECYITEDWEDTGIANIMVIRGHVNGNRTFGIYLVDLKCLGVKDAGYNFNIPDAAFWEQWDECIDSNFEQCDYTLAHNIIYGAVAFAEDYGFKPHKNFEVAQYILEEDDDKIPLMDIQFGDPDGKPSYWAGPYESYAKQQQILKTLERTAGAGNFHFTISPDSREDLEDDEDGDFDEDDEEYDFDEDDEDDADDWDEDDDTDGEKSSAEKTLTPKSLQEFARGEKKPNLYELFVLLSVSYRLQHPNEKYLRTEVLNKDLDIDEELESKYTINDGQIDKIQSFALEISELNDAVQLERWKDFLKENGDHPAIYFFLYSLQTILNQDSPKDIVKIFDEKYPDYLEFQFFHAGLLAIKGRTSEAKKRLGGKDTLPEGFPYRKGNFNLNEWIFFNLSMAKYCLTTMDLNNAVSYANEVAESWQDDPNISNVLEMINRVLLSAVELPENG